MVKTCLLTFVGGSCEDVKLAFSIPFCIMGLAATALHVCALKEKWLPASWQGARIKAMQASDSREMYAIALSWAILFASCIMMAVGHICGSGNKDDLFVAGTALFAGSLFVICVFLLWLFLAAVEEHERAQQVVADAADAAAADAASRFVLGRMMSYFVPHVQSGVDPVSPVSQSVSQSLSSLELE